VSVPRERTEATVSTPGQALAGKVAVVTGGGRNVGEAIALRFAREGARVAVVDLDKDRAQRTVDLIEVEVPGAGAAFVCDVSEKDSVREMAAAVVETFGGVDVLVNNVAITDRGATVLDLDEDEWDRVIKVTLTSVFLCTKYVGRRMVETGRGGSVITIGSTSGYRARPNATAYPAAKAAVINLTRSFAAQLAPFGIRANSVTPNKVGSPVGQDVEPDDRKRRNLVGRGGRPEDIANAVLFLASEESGFIDATDLVVDGGVLNGPMD
jgi:NAD(P)-dependent dehydrogenase (short-subunit alcohol dehydrogenase family)